MYLRHGAYTQSIFFVSIVYLSICLSVCLSIHLFTFPPIHLFIYSSVHLFIYLVMSNQSSNTDSLSPPPLEPFFIQALHCKDTWSILKQLNDFHKTIKLTPAVHVSLRYDMWRQVPFTVDSHWLHPRNLKIDTKSGHILKEWPTFSKPSIWASR